MEPERIAGDGYRSPDCHKKGSAIVAGLAHEGNPSTEAQQDPKDPERRGSEPVAIVATESGYGDPDR